MPSKLKGKAKGARVTIRVTSDPKTKRAVYTAMFGYVATYFGISPDPVTGVKGKNGRMYYPRGSRGAGSIKVPKAPPTGKVVKPSYYSIPIPGGVDHREISEFLTKRCTKNKPKSYVTKDGRTVPILGAK